MNLNNILKSKKKLLPVVILFLLVLGIPLAVFIAQKQQEIRQRAASGDNISLFFSSESNCSQTVSSVSYNPGEQKTLSLCANTGTFNINSFDVIANVTSGLNFVTINSADEGVDAAKLNTELFRYIRSDGTIRFAKATTNTAITNLINGSAVKFGSITFTINSVGSGSIAITAANFTAAGITGYVSATTPLPTLAFSIINPTSPPTSTHHACVNQTCQTVAGGGSNTCSSNQDCIVTNTPTGTPNTSGTFTFNRLPSATLQPGNAKFYFTYSGTSNNYKIHLSSSPTFASDIYFDFAQGAGTLNDINILITETTNADPAKYASYVCNKTLYWKVVSATGVESSIQSATVVRGSTAGSSCPIPASVEMAPKGTVFVDNNRNGVWDSVETAYTGGAKVKLKLNPCCLSYELTTPSNGTYDFNGVPGGWITGDYTLTLTAPTSYNATTTNPLTVHLDSNTFGPVKNFGISLIATNTLTPTLTITAPPGRCTVAGDAKPCDGCVGMIDYYTWLDEYNIEAFGGTSNKNADFQPDGHVDLIDYSIWLDNFNPLCTDH